MAKEKKEIGKALNWIIKSPLVYGNKKKLDRHLKSLNAVLKKIKDDKEGFKVLLGTSAEPYIQILDCLIDLYQSEKIDLSQKSEIQNIVHGALDYCSLSNPGFACSFRYISEVAKLEALGQTSETEKKSELYNALIELCDACPYKNIETL